MIIQEQKVITTSSQSTAAKNLFQVDDQGLGGWRGGGGAAVTASLSGYLPTK